MENEKKAKCKFDETMMNLYKNKKQKMNIIFDIYHPKSSIQYLERRMNIGVVP